ncbi:MAG: hypothetical protein ACRC9K_02235 [Afipia sp.]
MDSPEMILLKRLIIFAILMFVIAVFGLFAFNFYRQYTSGSDPAAKPPVIYERTGRPSRA